MVTIYANSETSEPVISPLAERSESSLSPDSEKENFTFEELGAGFVNGVNYKEEGGIYYPEFLEEQAKENQKDIPNYFYLTIPKLEINQAKVETNSSNLDPTEALGHYNGSCLPDEACNVFIFGHSTFASSPNRYADGDYKEVFSKLEELEYGDEFQIEYKGQVYKYIVELTKVQKPENVNPLDEPLPKSLGKHESTVELFTCTPSGTTKYRLSVVGKLVK